MSDYKQRFRERFDGCLHFVAEEHFPDILAFIDEVYEEGLTVGLETANKGKMYNAVIETAREAERAELIAHVEGVKWKEPAFVSGFDWTERMVKVYHSTLDDILNYLREPEEPDASQGCCWSCISVDEPRSCTQSYCGCNSKRKCCTKCVVKMHDLAPLLCGNTKCKCHSPQGDKAEGSV